MRFIAFLIALALVLPPVAWAAETAAPSDVFGKWRAFRVMEKGNHVCYMVAHPIGWVPPKPAPVKKDAPKKNAPAKAKKEQKAENPLLLFAATKSTTVKAAPATKKNAKKEAKPKKEAKREAYVMITFRPAETMAPVFSYNAGTGLKEEVEVKLTIGKDSFSLFAVEDAAWARSTALDQAIVKALRKGGTIEVTATTASGTVVKDKFDLKGAEQAYDKIAGSCGIP